MHPNHNNLGRECGKSYPAGLWSNKLKLRDGRKNKRNKRPSGWLHSFLGQDSTFFRGILDKMQSKGLQNCPRNVERFNTPTGTEKFASDITSSQGHNITPLAAIPPDKRVHNLMCPSVVVAPSANRAVVHFFACLLHGRSSPSYRRPHIYKHGASSSSPCPP